MRESHRPLGARRKFGRATSVAHLVLQHGITVTYSELSSRLNRERSSPVKPGEQGIEVGAREPPLEGFGDLLVMTLEGEQPGFELF